jgi:hypothetical protein
MEETNIIYYFYIDKDGNIDKEYTSEDNIGTLLDPLEWNKYDEDGEDMICFCKIQIIYDDFEQRAVDIDCHKTINDMPLNRYINKVVYEILNLIVCD